MLKFGHLRKTKFCLLVLREQLLFRNKLEQCLSINLWQRFIR